MRGFTCQEAPGPDPTLFPHRRATPILNAVRPGSPAEWIVKSIQRYGSLSFAFVAEDGSAIAVSVAPVSKIDVTSGATLSTGEHYRLEVRGETLTAFNVSQETYVRKNFRDSDAIVSLMPLIMLDRYRMLCVNGAGSIWDSQNPKHPTRTLFLALIDDRQRGPHPNLVRAIKVPGEVGQFRAVGARSGKYLIQALVKSKVRYLEVDPDTLDYRWGKAPDGTGSSQDIRAIQKKRPGFSSLASARWAANSYFQQPRTTGITEGGNFVWDGTDLRSTGTSFLVAASVNGAYAWAADTKTGGQWLLQR